MVGEDGKGLVCLAAVAEAVEPDRGAFTLADHRPVAERRQLTMLFCDLVDSTPLASRFDIEEWRDLMGTYYDTCAKVIAQYDGHIALYLGDGLLVYFGYPYAHEDDAQRAVRRARDHRSGQTIGHRLRRRARRVTGRPTRLSHRTSRGRGGGRSIPW